MNAVAASSASARTASPRAGLVRAGYASVAPETMRAGRRAMIAIKMRITDAERKALATRH
jgi:hypothetical protein